MSQPAARVADPVLHPIPPVLTPLPGKAPGSPNVLIGNVPAWRGISPEQLAQLLNAMKDAEIAIKKAETATKLASTPEQKSLAAANEVKVKAEQAKKLGEMMAGFAAVADVHVCATPLPLPIHISGVVSTGSQTVSINGQPACRAGDEILEANLLTNVPPLTNRIRQGWPTVLIGG
jgi:uncharacterized Zn-binding protein involved in type VI secretion